MAAAAALEAAVFQQLWRGAEPAAASILAISSTPSETAYMIRKQVFSDKKLYERAKSVAKKQGVSFAELCRRSLAEAVSRQKDERPWMRFVGIVDGDRGDSTRIDAAFYERNAP